MNDLPEELHPELLELIRCPVTHGPLQALSADRLEEVNAAIARDQVCNRIGQVVREPLQAALVNEEESLLVPIRGGIVTLIADELIPTESLGWKTGADAG